MKNQGLGRHSDKIFRSENYTKNTPNTTEYDSADLPNQPKYFGYVFEKTNLLGVRSP